MQILILVFLLNSGVSAEKNYLGQYRHYQKIERSGKSLTFISGVLHIAALGFTLTYLQDRSKAPMILSIGISSVLLQIGISTWIFGKVKKDRLKKPKKQRIFIWIGD
jgi:hypothetical protein